MKIKVRPAVVSVRDRPELWGTKRVQISLILDVEDLGNRTSMSDQILINILKEKAEKFTLELHEMFGEKVTDFCFESKVDEVINQILDKTGAPIKMAEPKALPDFQRLELNQVYEAEVIED